MDLLITTLEALGAFESHVLPKPTLVSVLLNSTSTCAQALTCARTRSCHAYLLAPVYVHVNSGVCRLQCDPHLGLLAPAPTLTGVHTAPPGMKLGCLLARKGCVAKMQYYWDVGFYLGAQILANDPIQVVRAAEQLYKLNAPIW